MPSNRCGSELPAHRGSQERTPPGVWVWLDLTETTVPPLLPFLGAHLDPAVHVTEVSQEPWLVTRLTETRGSM